MGTKILVLTMECWNSKTGANTFSSLLKNYPSSDVANIYIREGFPDSDCCSRYFQISEQKVIDSIIRRNIKTGKEICLDSGPCKSDIENENRSRELYNKNRIKRSYIKLFIRELIWKIGVWKTKELDSFLDDYNPDIVLFCMGGYIHFNRICRYVVKRTKAKAIGYFWDDNFTFTHLKESLGHTALRFFQRKSLKKLAKKCNAFWAITHKTKREADEFFGVNCKILTKPIDFAENERFTPYQVNTPIKILYTGNLLIGRFEVIKLISRALEKINKNGTKVELDVYSATYIAPEEIAQLSKFVNMKGVVPQEEAIKMQTQADILLFVEALTGSDSRIARLSFSTKITDYLHSGKCIFAIGSKDTAPMEYLSEQGAALVASTEEEIYTRLKEIIDNPACTNIIAKSAFECGKRNHERAIIEKTIMDTFTEVLGEKP